MALWRGKKRQSIIMCIQYFHACKPLSSFSRSTDGRVLFFSLVSHYTAMRQEIIIHMTHECLSLSGCLFFNSFSIFDCKSSCIFFCFFFSSLCKVFLMMCKVVHLTGASAAGSVKWDLESGRERKKERRRRDGRVHIELKDRFLTHSLVSER